MTCCGGCSCCGCLEGEGSALDLLAVASGRELLEVGLVLAWDEGVSQPEKEWVLC